VDAAVFLGMALAVTLKNRTCAVILFLWNTGHLIVEPSLLTTFQIMLELLITAVLFLGVAGTFALHSISKEDKRMLHNSEAWFEDLSASNNLGSQSADVLRLSKTVV
jgi:thiamine transporter ThiT